MSQVMRMRLYRNQMMAVVGEQRNRLSRLERRLVEAKRLITMLEDPSESRQALAGLKALAKEE